MFQQLPWDMITQKRSENALGAPSLSHFKAPVQYSRGPQATYWSYMTVTDEPRAEHSPLQTMLLSRW